MNKREIKKDDIFGIYRVIMPLEERSKDGHRFYLVECLKCHKQIKLLPNCFAYKSKICKECHHNNISWNIRNRRLERIWNGIKDRCYNIKDRAYRFYGEKGIKICAEWLNKPLEFESWAFSSGYTDELSIDRIDSSKDYCPGNCRWIPLVENCRFKSTTNFIEIDGILKSGRQWSEYLGYGVNYINKKIRTIGLENTKKFIEDKLLEKTELNK